MPWYTAREQVETPFGYVEESAPAPETRMRARGAAFSEALDNLSTSVGTVAAYRAYLDSKEETLVTKDDALRVSKSLGVEDLHGIGEDGISRMGLSLLIDRQRRKQSRRELMAAAELSSFETLGITLAGSVADPINLVAFGSGAATGAARAGIAARAARGFAEGVAANAAVEPLFFTLSRYSGDDYGMMDSLLNVTLGGALGTGFHLTGYAVGSLRERRSAGLAALAQIDSDRAVEVSPIVADAKVQAREDGLHLREPERLAESDVIPGLAVPRQELVAPEITGSGQIDPEASFLRPDVEQAAPRSSVVDGMRGPAATDPAVRAEMARAKNVQQQQIAAPAKPTSEAPKAEPSPEVAELRTLLEAETEEGRAILGDEDLKQVLEVAQSDFAETDSYIKTLGAAVTCARTRGA